MNLLKIILAFCLVFTGSVSFAGRGHYSNPNPVAAQTNPQPVPPLWTTNVCEQYSKQLCVIAQGWSWLRSAQVVWDSAYMTTTLSTGTYLLGLVAQRFVGNTPVVVYILTASKVGMQAGVLMYVGGAVVVAAGTLFSAAGFLLASTTQTGAPEEDEFLTGHCRAIMAPFKADDGLQKLLQLTPEEMEQVLPCIPADKNLNELLSGVSRNGPALENQIHAN
ncbi:MAG: hypothetical protein ACXVA9_04000 [Bdellovibrionales bacterium]